MCVFYFFCVVYVYLYDAATTEIYTYCHTLSLHDVLPICMGSLMPAITSISPAFSREMARVDGVPPNRSVSRITPDPSLTRATASMTGDGKSTRLNSSH